MAIPPPAIGMPTPPTSPAPPPTMPAPMPAADLRRDLVDGARERNADGQGVVEGTLRVVRLGGVKHPQGSVHHECRVRHGVFLRERSQASGPLPRRVAFMHIVGEARS